MCKFLWQDPKIQNCYSEETNQKSRWRCLLISHTSFKGKHKVKILFPKTISERKTTPIKPQKKLMLLLSEKQQLFFCRNYLPMGKFFRISKNHKNLENNWEIMFGVKPHSQIIQMTVQVRAINLKKNLITAYDVQSKRDRNTSSFSDFSGNVTQFNLHVSVLLPFN